MCLQVFYNTALLGYHGVHRSDLQLLHVNLGSGWVEMLRRACSKLFGAYAFGGSLAPPEDEPWKSTAAQQAAKGAFLYLVSQGMRVLQQMREGGAYTTSTTSLRFDGLNSAAVDSWIVWCNRCNGETSNTKRQRKHRAKE